MRLIRLLVLIGVVALVVRPTSAAADGRNSGGLTTDDGGLVYVEIDGSSSGGYDAHGYHRGTRLASDIECHYFTVIAEPWLSLPSVEDIVTDMSVLTPDEPLWLSCRDRSSGDITYAKLFLWNPVTAPPLAPPVAVLAQMAVNAMVVPRPAVVTWPPGGQRGLVNLPVWLHLDNWAPVRASASAGGVTATVEAVPTRSVWSMAGHEVTCTDAGTTYDPARAPDPTSSSCSFTFATSSGGQEGGVFHNSARVVWRLRWWASTGAGADLGELTGPATGFDVAIEESQALIAPGGH